MYPDVIKIGDLSVSIFAIVGVIVMWLFSFALIQGYNENGRSILALICVILIHFIIVPVALFFIGMIINPPTSTLTPDGVEVKMFPRTSFYKWTDVGSDLRISNMRSLYFIAFGQFHSEVYLVPLSILGKRSKVLQTVKSYRAAALKAKSLN